MEGTSRAKAERKKASCKNRAKRNRLHVMLSGVLAEARNRARRRRLSEELQNRKHANEPSKLGREPWAFVGCLGGREAVSARRVLRRLADQGGPRMKPQEVQRQPFFFKG